MNSKTIAIVGAGPVGGILAAHLSFAGHTVLLVDTWKEHLDRIGSDGLRITGKEEILAHPTHLLASIGALGKIVPEFVFICTKACDLDNVLGALNDELLQSKAVFVSFQNGIDTEQALNKRIGPGRVLRGVVSYAGVLVGPGEIRESFFIPPNYLGWLDRRAAESCNEAANLLSESGLETQATGDISRYAWRKTLLNTCTMAIAAVTGMNMQEMVNFPPTARLIDLLLEESISVAAAHGFDYGPEFAESVREFNRHAGPHRPSMLVDLENGRKTENEYLVRRIADYGARKGVPVPVHSALAAVIDVLEMRSLEGKRRG